MYQGFYERSDMALINGVQHDISDLTAISLGRLIREAWIKSPEQKVEVLFSDREELDLAFDELNSLNFPTLSNLEEEIQAATIGQTIAHGIRGACEEKGNPCLINFDYEDRTFHLSGMIVS
jgi:hypothetical protein